MEARTVLIFFVVVSLEVVFCDDAPKEGDVGVCTGIVNEIRSYRVSRKCGKKRTCFKIEEKVVPIKKVLCCEGWKFYNGKCIPEGPVCEPECVNAQCTDNNNCTCNLGLVHINGTHCGPSCENGYYNDFSVPELTCKSKCSQECVNGTCTNYDTCTCNTGFRLKNSSKFECQPVCQKCDNGICVAPDICSCNDGYALKDDVCVPVCNDPCDNGYCSEPNKCKCNIGYSYDEGLKTCIPVCTQKCVNSSCVSPDECECWDGYHYLNASGSCRPYCYTCSNGECIAPNLCICNDGYEKHNDTCELIPLRNCRGCEASCNDTACTCANGTLCASSTEEAIVASTPKLAGLQLTWMLGGALGILLLILVLVIIHRTWRQRKNFEQKVKSNDYHERDSVMFTRPDTLLRKKFEEREENEDDDEERQTNIDLMPRVPSQEYLERI